MDSIGNHPLIREHCPHELLSFKAGLNQLYGNNPEAVRLAEDYLQLPVCTSANDFYPAGRNHKRCLHVLRKQSTQSYPNFGKSNRCLPERWKPPEHAADNVTVGHLLPPQCEYEKAIATNQEAIATYNDSIAPGNVVIAYGEQANLYAELGMYDQALEMNKKAQYYSMLKDSFGLGDLYRYRAQIFRNMNQKDSVIPLPQAGRKVVNDTKQL